MQSRMAVSLHGLATLYHKHGEYVPAEELYQQALTMRENARNPDHSSIAATLEDLASLYRATDRAQQAEEMDERAASVRSQLNDN